MTDPSVELELPPALRDWVSAARDVADRELLVAVTPPIALLRARLEVQADADASSELVEITRAARNVANEDLVRRRVARLAAGAAPVRRRSVSLWWWGTAAGVVFAS